jgi:hypothetical protein
MSRFAALTMAKTPTTEMIAAELPVSERVSLFCLASGTRGFIRKAALIPGELKLGIRQRPLSD